MKNKVILIFGCFSFLLNCTPANAQFSTISQEVLGSTGGSSGGVFPWGSMDYTVGEAVVFTAVPTGTPPLMVKVLTQGFHQPISSSPALDANVIYSDASCIGGNNGSASLTLLSYTGPVTYYWYPPLNDSSANVAGLAPGSYAFVIDDGNFQINDTVVIGETQVDCADGLNFYTGITPNGDNNNDFWTIDSVSLIKENKVAIFNRWGDIVWSCENYDNVTDGQVWRGTNKQGQDLPDATYFYVLEANGRTYKGWIELTH